MSKRQLAAREKRFAKQRKERGWDDSDTWSLYTKIAEDTLPKLKRFKELNNGHPMGMSSEAWDEILDKIIYGFEFFANSDKDFLDIPHKEFLSRWKKAQQGMKLFAKWFTNLWW